MADCHCNTNLVLMRFSKTFVPKFHFVLKIKVEKESLTKFFIIYSDSFLCIEFTEKEVFVPFDKNSDKMILKALCTPLKRIENQLLNFEFAAT